MTNHHQARDLTEAERIEAQEAETAAYVDLRDRPRAYWTALNASLPGRVWAWLTGQRMRDGKWPGGS